MDLLHPMDGHWTHGRLKLIQSNGRILHVHKSHIIRFSHMFKDALIWSISNFPFCIIYLPSFIHFISLNLWHRTLWARCPMWLFLFAVLFSIHTRRNTNRCNLLRLIHHGSVQQIQACRLKWVREWEKTHLFSTVKWAHRMPSIEEKIKYFDEIDTYWCQFANNNRLY